MATKTKTTKTAEIAEKVIATSKSKTSADVPEARLTLDGCRREAGIILKSPLNRLNKAEKTALNEAVGFGYALRDASSIFKANGFKMGTDFQPWAEEFTNRSWKSCEVYVRLAKGDADGKLKNAVSMRHALEILKGNANPDGSDAPEQNPGKPERLSDGERVRRIVDQFGKLEDPAVAYQDIIDGMLKVLKEKGIEPIID